VSPIVRTIQEHPKDWPAARRRVVQLKAAGYKAYVTAMPDGPRVTIEPGKHGDFSRLPEPED
jgi:hypothetical protein